MFCFKIFFWFPTAPNLSLSPATHFYLFHSSLSPSARLIFLMYRMCCFISFSLLPDRFDNVHVSKNASFWGWPFVCFQFSSVQSLSRVRLFATPWIAACQASLSITISRSSLRLTSIESVMPSHPWSSPSPPALNPFQHQSFPMSQLFAWGGQSTEFQL